MTHQGKGMIVFAAFMAPLSFANEAIAQHSIDYYQSRTTAFTYTSNDGKTLPYRLFVPENYDARRGYPLVLALHGSGERGNDNKSHLEDYLAGWTDSTIQRNHPAFILMPQCPRNQQWVNTPWGRGGYSTERIGISNSLALAKQILDKVRGEYSIDPDRIYVMGASMGGYGTWDIVVRFPGEFAAAVPVCGAGDPTAAGRLTNLPIWAFHGDDDTVVPFSGSKDMVDAIRRAGGMRVKFTVYPGVDHGSYDMAWREPGLLDWLFSQARKAR